MTYLPAENLISAAGTHRPRFARMCFAQGKPRLPCVQLPWSPQPLKPTWFGMTACSGPHISMQCAACVSKHTVSCTKSTWFSTPPGSHLALASSRGLLCSCSTSQNTHPALPPGTVMQPPLLAVLDQPLIRMYVQVWVLDALPGEVRTGGQETQDHPRTLIAHLRQIPLPLPNRTALQNNLLDAGFSLTVARWASTNLQPVNGDHR